MQEGLWIALSSAALIAVNTAWTVSANAQSNDMPVQSTETSRMSDTAPTLTESTGRKIRFGSYKHDSKPFSGHLAGGYSADALLGMKLVDAKGESVGEVHDLLVSASNKIEKALVDVGGFIGIGAYRVALDIEELELTDDSAFVTGMTKDDLKAMPEYEQSESLWDKITK